MRAMWLCLGLSLFLVACGGSGAQPAPACLQQLVAPCTCQLNGMTCLRKGVSVTKTSPDGGACNTTGESEVTRVSNANGTLCYTLEVNASTGTACEIQTVKWLGPNGEVAQGYGSGTYATPTCASSGCGPEQTCAAGGGGLVSIAWIPQACAGDPCP